uniref:RGS domain-containing protein n=1 Tax=Rhabditophanes sp. KR3021 TaxID=114890 RepID=A0AC35U3C4_9BILA
MNRLQGLTKLFKKSSDIVQGRTDHQSKNEDSYLMDEKFADSINIVSQNLDEILEDPEALLYFIQFMEQINTLDYIKFLLNTKAFSVAYPPCLGEAALIYDTFFTSSSILSQFEVTDVEILKNGLAAESITNTIFDATTETVKKLINKRYLNKFMSSIFFKIYLLERLNNGSISLLDILRNETLLCNFIEFLENENERKYLEFIISVNTFLEDYQTDLNGPNLTEDAMTIYDKYISLQSTENLEFGDCIRVEVESLICTSVTGIPSSKCFLRPYQLSKKLLQCKGIPKYINESDCFDRLKVNLKFTIEMMNNEIIEGNRMLLKKTESVDDDNVSICSSSGSCVPMTPREHSL